MSPYFIETETRVFIIIFILKLDSSKRNLDSPLSGHCYGAPTVTKKRKAVEKRGHNRASHT